MKRLLSLKSITLAAVSMLVVAGSLAGGGVALAASDDALLQGNPPGTSGPFQALRDQALENFYKRAQLAVQEQGLRIDLANQVAPAVDSWITTLKGQGKDTSALESALSSFKSKVSAAQSAHDQGASVLNAHAGFDGNGKVTDPTQARDTLQQARQHLVDARLDLRDGTLSLRQAIRTFRAQNKPNKSAATAQPQ